MDIQTKGWYKGKARPDKGFPHNFAGYPLDTLEIDVTITSYEDIDKLITFLQIHRPGFILTREQILGAYQTTEEKETNGL